MSETDPGPGTVERGRREILLQNPNRYPDVDRRRLEGWLKQLVEELAPGGAGLAVRLVGDRAMRRYNRDFRRRQGTTDVLSFPAAARPAAAAPGADEPYLGDLAISVPVARRQAAERGHPLDRELKTLMLHGLLHCLGHDHERDNGAMERLERRLRRRWIEADV